jgi:adenosylmethionine-8-amino-7-oxononanoate aminotransferase
VVDVRVGGFLGGVTLDERLSAERVADRLIELGFISRALRGNTLQLSPPYIVSNQEVGDYVAAIEQAVAEEAHR